MRLDGNGTAVELDHLFPSWALSFCSVTWMEPFILCIFLLCFLSAPGSSYISQPSIPFPENILLRPVFQKERAVTLCRGEFRSRIRSGMYTLNTPCLKGSDQIRSVAQSCPTLYDPTNRSMPGLPVQHQLLEFTQTHVHRVSDAIQPSHLLSSPSPPAPNPSQHQSLRF